MKGYPFFALCFSVVALFLWGHTAHADDSKTVESLQIGKMKISVLNERQSSDGNPSILLGASSQDIKRYIPEGGYASSVNAFLVKTPKSVILVDAGFGTRLFENMESLGVKAQDVDVVLLTHMHGDHIGGLLRDGKATFPKAKIYVAQKEHDYWLSEANMKKASGRERSGFQKSVETLAAYKGRVQTFAPTDLAKKGQELVPGVTAIAAYGHTPGHTAFMVESDGKRLLLWGDLTHAMAIQMPLPHVAVTYDVDAPMAIATREAFLKFIAREQIPVAGMHIPMPGMGTIKKDTATQNGYTFTPATF